MGDCEGAWHSNIFSNIPECHHQGPASPKSNSRPNQKYLGVSQQPLQQPKIRLPPPSPTFTIVVVVFVCRSDHSQHPVCLPHEDQEGVAVLGSPSPPAGQILRRPSCQPVNGQHLLHGTDGSGSHRLPPLTSLSAIPSGKGCLLRASAHGGTLLWNNVIKKGLLLTFWIQLMFIFGFLSCLRLCWFFQVFELYRLLAVGISLWNQFAVPVLFSVFWFVLFIVQLCSDTMNGNASLGHQGIMFFLLTRCCEMCKIPLCGSLFQSTYWLFFLFNVQCLRVLCHSILSFGPDLRGVLSCSWTAQPMQVLLGRLCSCSEWKCHAQVR